MPACAGMTSLYKLYHEAPSLGLADLAEGRVKDFDAARIIARGKELLAKGGTH